MTGESTYFLEMEVFVCVLFVVFCQMYRGSRKYLHIPRLSYFVDHYNFISYYSDKKLYNHI